MQTDDDRAPYGVYWVSSSKMTFGVEVAEYTTIDDERIEVVVGGAPIVRRFIGQRFTALTGWMEKHGGLRVVGLSDESR